MPYFKKSEGYTDRYGTPIRVGDILKKEINVDPWEYFTCENGYTDGIIEVRCFNAHNIGMTEQDDKRKMLYEVKNLGNWKENLDIIKKYGPNIDECLADFEGQFAFEKEVDGKWVKHYEDKDGNRVEPAVKVD